MKSDCHIGENTVTLWAEITDRGLFSDIRYTDNTLSGNMMLVIRIAFAHTPIGTNLFTGSSAEQDNSITKALLLLVATGGSVLVIWIRRNYPAVSFSLALYVLTGSKKYTAAGRAMENAAERARDYQYGGIRFPVTTGDARNRCFHRNRHVFSNEQEDNPDEETIR